MKTLRVNNDEILVDENRARPKPFHSPAEALETHCDLLDWIDAEEGFAFTRDIVLKHRTNYGLDDEGNEVQPDDEGIVEGYRSALWEAVNQNNTMYVSAHMCDQLQALIPTFEDEPLWETDLPDQRGTVLFEAAIRATISDSRATTSQYPNDDQIDYWIKGFVYRRVWDSTIEVTRNGVYLRINVAAPPTDDAASADKRLLAFQANDGLIVWPLFDAGEMLISPGQWEAHGRPPVLPMPFCAVPFGPRVDAEEDAGTDLYQMRQLVVTLFRLVWQHILIEEDPSRPERRRMDRIARKHRRLPDDGEAIKVRHLRRIEGEFEHEPDVVPGEPREGHALTYRIIVKGHPRDQWYASLGPARTEDGSWNPASHRKIWINAHIRGPEDSPLVLKHSLDVVVR
jgi:hypothetical protein